MKEDYQLKKEIQNSIKKECLLCGRSNCIRAHSISKEKYLSPISEYDHVYGSHRQKGIFNLEKISINEASTFFNFCDDCDKIFKDLDNYDFCETNKKQIFLMFFRMLAAQVHQIKEEIIYYKKNIDNPNVKEYINYNQTALQKYESKINQFRNLWKNEKFDCFNSKVIKLNCEIPFVYFNIVNILFDLEGNNFPHNNEMVINIFSQNKITFILFVWEKDNDINLTKYINQISLINLKELEVYLTNMIIAFPFNFYIRPTYYLNWKDKERFEVLLEICSKLFSKNITFLFNRFMLEEFLNIFE